MLFPAFVASLALVAPAHAAVISEFEVFTPFGAGGGEVNGIVRASDGNFWVAETLANKVSKVATDGRPLGQIQLKGGSRPLRVATGPGGTVWVSLVGTKELARINPASHEVQYFSTDFGDPSCGPIGLIHGPGDRMYFTLPDDPGGGCVSPARVGRMNADGTGVTLVSGRGQAYDIAELGGKLFVTSPRDGVVHRLGSDLNIEATSAFIPGTPDGLAIGPDGNVWFTLFNETGGVGRIAPGFANGAGPNNIFLPPKPLAYAFGIAPGPEGDMYVGGRDNSRIARVRMDGSYAIYDIPNNRYPWELVLGADDDLWFTDIYGNRLVRFISTRPRAGTGAATVQSPTAATLSGALNTRGSATTAHFEYGPSPAYGASTPPQTYPSSVGDIPISAALTGLQPNTTYHFRLVAGNEEGVTATPNATFATPSAPQPTPRVAFRYAWRHLPARNRRSVRFTSLHVIGLTKGAKLRLICRGGKKRRCPFTAKTVKRTGAKRNLASILRRRYLRPGATVELRATMNGAIGRVVRLRINRRAVPVDSQLCIPLGKTKPQRSCPA